MELYSDTYYIQRVQEGDTACFACLVDRYSQPVFALIHRIVQNREEAEELMTQTDKACAQHCLHYTGHEWTDINSLSSDDRQRHGWQ